MYLKILFLATPHMFISDMPRVQAGILDMAHRYDLLGRALRDREEEIEGVDSRLTRNQSDYDRLNDWVSFLTFLVLLNLIL